MNPKGAAEPQLKTTVVSIYYSTNVEVNIPYLQNALQHRISSLDYIISGCLPRSLTGHCPDPQCQSQVTKCPQPKLSNSQRTVQTYNTLGGRT